MKKVLFISLLLIAVFLIGSAGVASALCSNFQDYTCKATEYHDGKLVSRWVNCVELCYDNPFYVSIESPCFEGTLYPALDYDNLLGTADACGLSGCSVERNGRSIGVKLSYIEEDEGFVDVYNCTPCNDCCRPPYQVPCACFF